MSSTEYDKELQAARTHTFSHEKDERWTAVDAYAKKHLHKPSSSHCSAIDYAINLSKEKHLPGIEISLLQGKWLLTQCQMINAKHVLEVGTLGGISSIWLALSGSDVKVTTVEIDPKRKAVAEEAIEHAGLSDRIEVVLGAGMDVLPKLRDEVKAGTRSAYDFVFIDADKPNNLNYFNESVQMVRSRGCIVVDNVVRRGRLADDEAAQSDPAVKGARAVIEAAGNDDRVSTYVDEKTAHSCVVRSTLTTLPCVSVSSTLLQTVGEKNYVSVE